MWLVDGYCTDDCSNWEQYAYDVDNTCVNSCPDGYQGNNSDYPYCQICPVNCVTCYFQDDCTSCAEGYYLLVPGEAPG